nr:MAG: DNA pilot protein [Microviridae sp.]
MGNDLLQGIVGGVEDALGFGSNVMNYESQRLNREQQLSLQQQSWAREDNAVQRRASDMKSAGINPLLAAGSSASASAPISVQGPQMAAPRLSFADKAVSGMSSQANIAQTKAQTDLVNAQLDGAISNAKSAGIDSTVKGELYDAGIPVANALNELKGKVLSNASGQYNLEVLKTIDPKTRAILGVADDAIGDVLSGAQTIRAMRPSPKGGGITIHNNPPKLK